MDDRLEIKLKNAPRTPGVYLMKGRDGTILYIGKARDLHSRIRAYWGGTDTRYMVPFLTSRTHDIEFIVTGTEKEALLLENTLIKAHHPRYNVDFRDDKAYFHIRIDPGEEFPRFHLVRRPKRDKARYFGPYPSSAAAKETLRFLQPIFPLRTCRDHDLKNRRRPCLEFEIKRCKGPCVGRIDAQAYDVLVQDSIAFLEGREKALVGNLRARMDDLAEALNFEEAAVLRDRIAAIEETLEKQKVLSLSRKDRDVFGFYREGDLTQVCAVFIRAGKIIGKKSFPLVRLGGETAEILSSVLKRYYDGEAYIPDEIITPCEFEDTAVIEEWLGEKKGKKVLLTLPRRGLGRDLTDMAEQNAASVFTSERRHEIGPSEALALMAEKLELRTTPARIEGFDISNIGGRYAVGSLVTFIDGMPWKEGYRRFRIRTVPGADDYAMLYEVLKRRYENRGDLPDLLVVDGGKGQAGVAVAVLRELDIGSIDVIGFAKERPDETAPGGEAALRPREGVRYKGEDRVYLPRKKEPIYVSRWPAVLFLLQHLRDEAHRFAVSYFRKVKEKEDLRSVVDGIPGIGARKKKDLLTFFGDLRKLRRASIEELQNVEGIGPRMAERIHRFFAEGP